MTNVKREGLWSGGTKIYFSFFSREVLNEERLSMSRILVCINRGEPLVFSENKTENLDFKYNYIVHLIVKLKYLSIKIVR